MANKKSKIYKNYKLTPAAYFIKGHGGNLNEFKEKVCEIMGWTLNSYRNFQTRGIDDIGVSQYEAICQLLKQYGIKPEDGWLIKEY